MHPHPKDHSNARPIVVDGNDEGSDQVGDLLIAQGVKNHAQFPAIFRLPTELLSMIFLVYIRIFHKDTNRFYNYPHAALHTLQQVCHVWNDIVHSTPRLWSFLRTKVPFTSTWVSRALERSADVMLAVDCYTCGPHGSDLLTPALSLLSLIPRLKSFHLEIRVHNDYYGRVALHRCEHPYISHHAPHLEEFVIKMVEPRGRDVRGYYDIPALFSDQAPVLRRLEALPLMINWSSPLLHNLRILHITAWTTRTSPLTGEQYYRRLEHCPLLEELRVRGRNSEVTSFQSLIHLPNLRILDLQELRSMTAHSLLNSMRESPVIRLSLGDIRGSTCLDLSDLKIFSAISHLLSSPHGVEFDHISNFHHYTLIIQSEDGSSQLKWQCSTLVAHSVTLYSTLLSPKAQLQLRSLKLKNFSSLLSITRFTLYRFFHDSSNIHDLDIEEEGQYLTHQDIDMIISPLDLGPTRKPYLFPHLKNLTIHYCGNPRLLLDGLERRSFVLTLDSLDRSTTHIVGRSEALLQPLTCLTMAVQKSYRSAVQDSQDTYRKMVAIVGADRCRILYIDTA